MEINMTKRWVNFVIFHKELFDANYTCDRSFDLNKYIFIKANEKFKPIYNKNFGYNVIYENKFNYYDKRLQKRLYYAPSAIYHIYKNNLYKEYDFIGFLEYDLTLKSINKGGLINVTETIDRIVNRNKGEKLHISYSSIHKFRDLYRQGQTDLVLDGKNWMDTIIQDYNNYFGTEHNINCLKNSLEKANTQQSFLVDQQTFEHIMGFITHVIENKLAERCENRLMPATFLERYFAVALRFEDIKKNIETINLNLHHAALGYKVGYKYEKKLTDTSMDFIYLMKKTKQFLNKVFIYNRFQKLNERKKQQRQIKNGYEVFCQLSKKGDILNILFAGDKTIIILKDGRRFHFNPSDRVARMYSVPCTGTFEHKETNFVRNFVKRGQVCVDAGASFGWYTILFSKLVGPTGHVHAFEPMPHTFHVLQSNTTLNKCSNVTLNNVALDATNGQKNMFLPDIGVSGSFCLHKYKTTYQTISCNTKTLDDYCLKRKINRVDFIKADIEGAEFLMLKGAINIIKSSMPVMFLEVQGKSTNLFGYKPKEIFEFLFSLGYRSYYVNDEGNLIKFDNYLLSKLPDNNFIFLPPK
jgi:FkbM family methyltransferase